MRIQHYSLLFIVLLASSLTAGPNKYFERLQTRLSDAHGALKKTEVFYREKQEPGAGLMAYFASDISAATLYVYDRRLGPIPDGADSDKLLREFSYNLGQYQLRATGEDAIQKTPTATTAPLFENLKIEASGQKMPLGEHMTRYARVSYEQDGNRYIEHLFMTGHKAHFWLITYAYGADSAALGEQQMADFIAALPGLMN